MSKDFYPAVCRKYIPWMNIPYAEHTVDIESGHSNTNRRPDMGIIPAPPKYRPRPEWHEAVGRIHKEFPNAPGECPDEPLYALDRESALKTIESFIRARLEKFGEHQDMISSSNHYLYHSVLSPTLNIGLITPGDVLEPISKLMPHVKVEEVIEPSKKDGKPRKKVKINHWGKSIEAFVRQIVWREYMRMITINRPDIRIANYFASKRLIGPKWYTGTTGVTILDNTIKQVIKTGYTHHIERLMVLGAWMLMMGAEPHSAFKWFMEMFVDAYEWVMIPNIYGMSLWATGPVVVGRPYFSSGEYFRRMSDYPPDAIEQWNKGYVTFFMEKGPIIERKPLYIISNWYNKWKAGEAKKITT
jgi:deoxyribodipyrimidine photolyase-related protein